MDAVKNVPGTMDPGSSNGPIVVRFPNEFAIAP